MSFPKCRNCSNLRTTIHSGFLPECQYQPAMLSLARELSHDFVMNSDSRTRKSPDPDLPQCEDTEDCSRCELLLSCAIASAGISVHNRLQWEPYSRQSSRMTELLWQFCRCEHFTRDEMAYYDVLFHSTS